MANIRDLNRLVLWVQKRPQRICFEALTPPLRLVCVTDSAFQAQATDGLAMRGCLLLLAGSDSQGQWQHDAVPAPNGRVHVIDWFARRQPHVCRSTFAAELHSHLDGMNQGLLIQTVLTKIALGPLSAAQLSELLETGSLLQLTEACLDARSVFDTATAPHASVPADKHLHVHVLKCREWIQRGGWTRGTCAQTA